VLTKAGTGVIAVMPGGAFVFSGTHLGRIHLILEVCDEEPAMDLDRWEAAAEVSLNTTTVGQMRINEWEDGPRHDLPLLTPHGPGAYRVRACVRGRGAGRHISHVTGPAMETHQIQIWPAGHAPDVVYKQDVLKGPDLPSQVAWRGATG
jgi:hypothetical protein